MIKEDLYAKEAVIGEGERRKRFAIVLNRKTAVKDRLTREKHLKYIDELLAANGASEKKEHTKALCALVSHPVYGRYLKAGADGKLKIDKGKVAAEEKLDGKFLIKTSDDTLSLSDMVQGYKQLHDIERGFRTLKSELELRPVYHRKSDRIRAHVLLCWLALLLVRIVETETGITWFQVQRMLKQVNLTSLQFSEGIVHQSTTLTKEQSDVYHSCKVKAPPKIIYLQPS
jgi:transposase